MKILLTGDSWASGDWNQKLDKKIHKYDVEPVLLKLLEQDGHDVIFKPHPGFSDIPSIEEIKEHHDKVDLIIFFKTQVSRLIVGQGIEEKRYLIQKGSDWPEYCEYIKGDFTSISQEIKNEFKKRDFYFYLNMFIDYLVKYNNIETTFKKINDEVVYKPLYDLKNKILLIGGIERINSSLKFKYEITDLIEFLTGYQNVSYSLSRLNFVGLYELISKKLNLNNKNQLLDELLVIAEKENKLFDEVLQTNNIYFGPYDNYHPNKNAINYYYNKLIKIKLKEFQNDYRTAI